MSRDWEATLRAWAKPPSETEQAKSENAERLIRKAIAASTALANRSLEVFTQGSYRNNTNVRLDSDVDICVLCTDYCFTDYDFVPGLTDAEAGINRNINYSYTQFKNDVGNALTGYFGAAGVSRGDKAFDIHENTYRVDADVVATFEERRFHRHSGGSLYVVSGTAFDSDSGSHVVNWPRQHAENGISKNSATGGRFKSLVRALKRLRNEMADNKVAAAQPIPSYLIECLVWNVPNEMFGHSEYKSDMRRVLAHTFNHTMTDAECLEWGEVNELKYLFRLGQPWTREGAHSFLSEAWNYMGFE